MNIIGIMHMYNEEYLLPFWLSHHKDIFDKIIIINYHSTDNSLNICKEIVPDCIIINTRNEWFGASDADREVMDIENQYEGFKICLNITEFLMTYGKNIREILKEYENTKVALKLNTYVPLSLNEYYPKDHNELFKNLCNTDIKFNNDLITKEGPRGYRYMHNYNNGYYNCGRHHINHPHIHSNDIFLITLYWYPMNSRFMERKMQIKHKIPKSDRDCGNGYHHFWTEEKIKSDIISNYEISHHLSILDEKLYNHLNNK